MERLLFDARDDVSSIFLTMPPHNDDGHYFALDDFDDDEKKKQKWYAYDAILGGKYIELRALGASDNSLLVPVDSFMGIYVDDTHAKHESS